LGPVSETLALVSLLSIDARATAFGAQSPATVKAVRTAEKRSLRTMNHLRARTEN
jgi:hypothetical protein